MSIKIELINPFMNAAFSVLEMVLGEAPKKGDVAVQPRMFTSYQVNVNCGVTGQAQGNLIYGMSLATADKIASAMIGQTIATFDAMAASAIAELANMISGNGSLGLSEIGIICDITPPTIIKGSSVEISTLGIPAIVVPFLTSFGEFTVCVGLQMVGK